MCESSPEEMASFDVLPPQNGTLESFDSSEFSLIPEQPPEEEVQRPSSTTAPPLHTAPLISAHFDLSEEEIQQRLLELAEDNRSLRESLQSSSAIMKSELSAIASWHHNVTSTIAQHQISLQEAQARIQQLEKEKSELMLKIEEGQGEEKAENNAILSDEDSEYEIIQKKSKDTESLKLQLKDAEHKISFLTQEIEEHNLKIESMKSVHEEHEKEKNELKSKLQNQEELNSKLYDLLKQVAASEETNNALKSKVKQLEEQLQSQDRAPAMAAIDDLLLTHAEEHQEKVNAMKGHSMVVHELESKVKLMEEKLKAELHANEVWRKKNLEDKKILSVLQSNYDRVTKILQMQSRKEKQKAESMDSERVEESRKSQEQVDLLTARLFDCEQRLEESQARVDQLTKELELAKEEAEQPPILKAQVEVLKIDLDNAVLAKEAAQEELLQANQQLKDLQASASFCSNCGAGSAHGESPSRGSRGKRRSHKQSDRSGPDLFICPICQFGFTELQALENHVNTCIDKAQ